MPFTVLEGVSPAKNHCLRNFTRLRIPDINVGVDTNQKYIKGQVCIVWPLQRNAKYTLLKICIKEVPGSESICVFLHDEFAEGLADLSIQDTFVITNMYTESNTSRQKPGSHPCQLIADNKLTIPSIWVYKQSVAGPSNMKNISPTIKNRAATPKRTYTYTPLAEVSAGKIVNVYGVVKFIRPPWKTRGTDWAMMVSLVDPSLDVTQGEKLKCMMFSRDEQSLPKLKIGQILRLHRLKINPYQGGLQGGNGPGFSWLAVDGAVGAPVEPVVVTSSFVFVDSDVAMVEKLRVWADSAPLSPEAGPHVAPAQMKTISELKTGDYFDLVCQVVDVCVVIPHKQVVLRVWDGTKPQQAFFEAECPVVGDRQLMSRAAGLLVDVFVFDDHAAKTTNIKAGDVIKLTNLHANRPKQLDRTEITLHGGSSYGRHVEKLPSSSTESKVLQERLARVAEPHDLAQPSTSTHHSPHSHSPILHSFTHSPIQPTPRLKLLQKIQSSVGNNLHHCGLLIDKEDGSSVASGTGGGPMEMEEDENCMTRTVSVLKTHHHQPRSSLAHVLSTPPPHKFRIRAEVAAVHPPVQDVRDTMQLHCDDCQFLSAVPPTPGSHTNGCGWEDHIMTTDIETGIITYSCPSCRTSRKNSALRYIFMLRLMLVTKEGWILAGLWGDDAEVFLRVSPVRVLKDCHLASATLSSINKLSEGGQHHQPPLMDCCIKSYQTNKGVRYQVFNTELVPDDTDT